MVAVTLLLEVPVLLSTLPRIQARLLVYAIPQALTLAIPFGVALGIFVGSGGSAVSFRLTRVVLAIAIVCSLASGVMIGWVAPLSERAFSAAGRASVPLDELTEHELTLNELGQRSDLYQMRSNLSSDARRLATYYHFRWAFSFATFLLGLLAVSARHALSIPTIHPGRVGSLRCLPRLVRPFFCRNSGWQRGHSAAVGRRMASQSRLRRGGVCGHQARSDSAHFPTDNFRQNRTDVLRGPSWICGSS